MEKRTPNRFKGNSKTSERSRTSSSTSRGGSRFSDNKPKYSRKPNESGDNRSEDSSRERYSKNSENIDGAAKRRKRFGGDSGSDYRPSSRNERSDRPFHKREEGGSRDENRSSFRSNDRNNNGGERRENRYNNDRNDRPFRKREEGGSSEGGNRSFRSNDRSDRPYHKREEGGSSEGGNRSFRSNDRSERPYHKREEGGSSEGGNRSFRSNDRSERPYHKREEGGSSEGGNRSFRSNDRGERPYHKREEGGSSEGGNRSSFRSNERGDRPYRRREEGSSSEGGNRSSFRSNERGDRPYRRREEGSSSDENRSSFRSNERGDRPYRKREEGGSSEGSRPSFRSSDRGDRPYRSREEGGSRDDNRSSFRSNEGGYNRERRNDRFDNNRGSSDRSHSRKREDSSSGLVRLNKFIANAGICSRREADVIIESGAVSVNGNIVTEMGFKVSPTDNVNYGGQKLVSEAKKYLLLNKPKDFITTLDDPMERKTVMQLINGACKERIYPVGRLDRNTTGLLLFTNDGEMAKKLTHPSHGARKLYHVELNRPITHNEMKQILEGIELEDGIVKADDIQYAGDGEDKRIVGVELHSGKNRIVRRIFEHLGCEVHKLDRVIFASLTKKDLPRGNYRFLTNKEIDFLKMI